MPQKAVMFSDTVRNNVDYGKDGKEKKTDEQIKKAIEVAQGKEFVEEMENTYDAHIASRRNKHKWRAKTKTFYSKSNS